MIVEIHRPATQDEALSLLGRAQPITLPLGGGTVLNRLRYAGASFALVDVQQLGLDILLQEGNWLRVGAAVKLEQLLDCSLFAPDVAAALRASLDVEAGANLRRMASMAGTLVSCDGRSPFVTALLALDARLIWAQNEDSEALGDFLALRDGPMMLQRARLMTEIRIPLNVDLRFDQVARTPLDRPMVCVAVGCWPGGRTRVALGGFGKAPIMAMDGPEATGASLAARDAYRFAGDAYASAEYRMQVAGVLCARLVNEFATDSTAQTGLIPDDTGDEE